MKKILLFFALLASFACNAQIRVCQLPQVTTGTPNDYIIKEDSTCNGTRKIKVSDFLTTYGISGGGGSIDTSSISSRIDLKVDTIYKNSTRDSIIYTINSRRHAILDSVGSGSGSSGAILTEDLTDSKISDLVSADTLDGSELIAVVQNDTTKSATVSLLKSQMNAPVTVEQSDAGLMLSGIPNFPTDGQTYIFTNLGITGIDHIRTVGMIDYSTPGFYKFNDNCEAYVTALEIYAPCKYDLENNKLYLELYNKMFVSVDGAGGITIDSVVNNEWNGITFTAANTSGGTYLFTPSQTLQTIFTAVSMHTEQVVPQGTDIAGFASSFDDYAHDEYFLNIYDTIFGGNGSVAFPHNLITFIGYIYN